MTTTSRGRYCEQLEVGEIVRHRPGRTVEGADTVFFSTLTMDAQGLHLDEAAAAPSEFGQHLANSMFALSTIVGLSVSDLRGDHGGSQQALSGTRPDNELVVFEHRGTNRHDRVVATGRRTALMFRRPAASRGPSATLR